MFRYLTLLAAAMFLTLTILGNDRGQERLGLAGAYAPPPPVPLVPAVAAAPAEPDDVVLATFEPDAEAAEPEPPAAPPTVAAEVTEAAPEPETPTVMWVDATSVNLREAPSTDSAVLGKLKRSEAVTVVAELPDGWVRVRLEGDGDEGFVAARFLTATDPATN